MNRWTLVLVLGLFVSIALESLTRVVNADHLDFLPGLPTPAIQNLLQDGERTFCVNAAANSYPNFVSQLQQTYDSQQAKLGNGNRQILGTFETVQAAGTAGCENWWNGRYDAFCSGCACSIHYAAWPIQTNVKLSLGYVDFRSCQGHEEGHAHGLHEQYKDSGGSIACTQRLDTVMDCGSGVWELQPRDVNLICDLYGVAGDHFHACAPTPPPCDPCWNPVTERWVFSDGRSFHPNSGCGEWFSAKNTKEWSVCAYNWDADPDLDGRFNEVMGDWVAVGASGSFYHDETGEWLSLVVP